jgi:hypothetical protein
LRGTTAASTQESQRRDRVVCDNNRHVLAGALPAAAIGPDQFARAAGQPAVLVVGRGSASILRPAASAAGRPVVVVLVSPGVPAARGDIENGGRVAAYRGRETSMPRGWFRRLAALSVVVAILVAGGAAGAQQVQPGYDVIRMADENGDAIPYAIWVAWSPTIVTTPDGGAWAFFSALPAGTEGVGVQGYLYAAHYDPAAGVWQPATRMRGGDIQFGASAVADGEGRIHLVYSDRVLIGETEEGEPNYGFSTLFYTVFADGAWSEPLAVAPADTAGHQLSPQLVLDGAGGLHVIWQDQRSRTAEQRDPETGSASNADVFVSDFAEGVWQAPLPVRSIPFASQTEIASRPYLATDGERLVAIWSVYPGITTEELRSASRVEWSARPLNDPAGWSEPANLL